MMAMMMVVVVVVAAVLMKAVLSEFWTAESPLISGGKVGTMFRL